MTTMTMPHPNGRKRPSLSEQINRLDSVLDGLSENLNDAVADAVKAAVGIAVKEAVQTALKEVLAHPTISAKLQPPTAPVNEPPPGPSRKIPTRPTLGQRLAAGWQQARGWAASVREACRSPLQTVRIFAGNLWHRSVSRLTAVRTIGELLWHFKFPALTALTVGVLMAVLVFFAGPWMAAVLSGIGAFVMTLAVQAGLWLRQLLKINADELA